MAEPQRIALVRLSHLGDVVLALPLFHALRARFPAARIAWVVQAEFAGLLEGLSGLERIVRFERRGGARAWLELKRELARFGPDLALDAQGNWKSAMATLASGAPRRVGLAPPDWRERGAWVAMTEFAGAVDPGAEHAFERTRALVRQLCGDVELRRDPALRDDERNGGRRKLEELVGGAAAPLLLQLSSADDVRAWPLSHALDFARRAAESGRTVLVLSGPGEVDAGRTAARELTQTPRVAHWVGQRGLRELAAVFSAAAERGGRYVGADTGPTHLAAACDLEVVVLSGPQSHLRTGPWPVAALATRGPGPHLALRSSLALDCAPCRSRTCVHPRGPVCMSSLEPQSVLAALRE